jgi:hypothetical protein
MIVFVQPTTGEIAVPAAADNASTTFHTYATWAALIAGEAPTAVHRFNGKNNYAAAALFFSDWVRECRDDSDWSVVECGPLPAPEVPATISARQIRLWLISSGVSLAQIETLIDNIEDPQQREYTRVEWEYAPYIERNHPMVAVFAAELGLTEAQVDDGFINAATL